MPPRAGPLAKAPARSKPRLHSGEYDTSALQTLGPATSPQPACHRKQEDGDTCLPGVTRNPKEMQDNKGTSMVPGMHEGHQTQAPLPSLFSCQSHSPDPLDKREARFCPLPLLCAPQLTPQ